MTGYGAHSTASDNYSVNVEVKSLNGKFLELNLKVPRNYMQNEMNLRNFLSGALKRGKVNGVVTVDVLNPAKNPLSINKSILRAYVEELKELNKELNIDPELSMEYLLSLPNVISSDGDVDPEEWSMIELCFHHAVRDLVESRKEEGKALERDMRLRCDIILASLTDIEKMLPGRIAAVRNRLLQSINEIKDSFNVDENRFEQELIYYIEKYDFNEENVRLRKHTEFFLQTLEEDESNGKKLSFISQEMGREINTVGSKANDAEIQVLVVRMKEELEKIKEQVQNIL